MKTKKIRQPFIPSNLATTSFETEDGIKATYVGTCPDKEYPYIFFVEGNPYSFNDKGVSKDKNYNLWAVEEADITPIWATDPDARIKGYWINDDSEIKPTFDNTNTIYNFNIFVSEKQAKSSIAMARLGQIMANDERFGDAITEKEWADEAITKFTIIRESTGMRFRETNTEYSFLAFHTEAERELFINENEPLIKDYFMLN